MDAFDADVLIYAAVPGHPLGEQAAALFRSAAPATSAGLGSVLLLPEVLSRPLRDGAVDEVRILARRPDWTCARSTGPPPNSRPPCPAGTG